MEHYITFGKDYIIFIFNKLNLIETDDAPGGGDGSCKTLQDYERRNCRRMRR